MWHRGLGDPHLAYPGAFPRLRRLHQPGTHVLTQGSSN